MKRMKLGLCLRELTVQEEKQTYKQIFTKDLDQCQDAEKCRWSEMGQRREGPASAGAESRDRMRTVRKRVEGQVLPQKSQTQPSLPSPNPCCPSLTLTSPSCHINSNPLLTYKWDPEEFFRKQDFNLVHIINPQHHKLDAPMVDVQASEALPSISWHQHMEIRYSSFHRAGTAFSS